MEEEGEEGVEGEELVEADEQDAGGLGKHPLLDDVELEEVPDGEDRPQKRSKAPSSHQLHEVDAGAHGSVAAIPTKAKGLRACLVCGLIKTAEQFLGSGCDNCENVISMREDKGECQSACNVALVHKVCSERVQSCTSPRFSGMVAMMDVKKSWVARYQRLKPNYVPGCYAVSVIGELPEEVLEMLDDARVAYIKRDFVDRSVATALK